jgi:hypothetical protein
MLGRALAGSVQGCGGRVSLRGLQAGRARGEGSGLLRALPGRELLRARLGDLLPTGDVLAQDGPDLGEPVPALPQKFRLHQPVED